MIAYIDEAGDEGTGGKGSRWLIIGCAMVADSDVDEVRDTVRRACTLAKRGDPKSLHFRNLNHDDRRGIISIITKGPWLGTIVASDTTKFLSGYLATPNHQFNNAALYVVERVSAMASSLNEQATLYFEERRNFNLDQFRQHIQSLLSRGDPRLDPQWISASRISTMKKGIDECLCIADGLANAGYKALEPHRTWRFNETTYLEGFKPSLWKGPPSDEDLYGWGLVLMPTRMFGDFVSEYPWIRDLAK